MAPAIVDGSYVLECNVPVRSVPRQWLRFRRDATTAATLIAEVAALYPLRDLTLEEPAIEDIVRRIYLEGV